MRVLGTLGGLTVADEWPAFSAPSAATSPAEIRQAHSVFAGVQARLIGAVLNGVEATSSGDYDGAYGYYRYPYPEP
jgi:hypothetical protein